MTRQERTSTAWLASIFALRMLGLFMILPIFSLYAKGLSGGSDAMLVGLAMGIYGLTQACLHIPLGWASDRVGRKPVIVAGLLLFAAGSLMGMFAHDVMDFVWARAVQGAGAISAAILALLSDFTRDEQRSKAMAMIGGSIGVTFAVSLMGAPLLYQWIGMNALFGLTAILALLGILVVLFKLPAEPCIENKVLSQQIRQASAWKSVLCDSNLLRLNIGIFTLHLTQMALFVVLPSLIAQVGHLAVNEHWKVYLPVMLLSFVLMLPGMIWAEKRGQTKTVKLLSIGLMLVAQLGFALGASSFWMIVSCLLAYFVAFNLLEAMLPSWVSRVAPTRSKGLALGVYNTTQALGLFVGGALGGWVSKAYGPSVVFAAITVLTLLWWCSALGLQALPKRPTKNSLGAVSSQIANA